MIARMCGVIVMWLMQLEKPYTSVALLSFTLKFTFVDRFRSEGSDERDLILEDKVMRNNATTASGSWVVGIKCSISWHNEVGCV